MTTPHPTPEEGMTPEERYEALCRVFEHTGHALAGFQADAVMKSIREAEAAGEARGRAMEREQMRTEALRVLSHVSDDDVENGRVFDRVDAALRAHTDKENSDG